MLYPHLHLLDFGWEFCPVFHLIVILPFCLCFLHRQKLLTLTSRPYSSASVNPPTESTFSFTPIKALSALPRLWDRKPSTPVRAGDKSRKLWKRIRFPFGGMKTETEGKSTAIGASKSSDYQRGVKRRCVDPTDAEETELEQRGRSFLETKWEMQAARKKRKMPEFNFNIHNDTPQEVFGFTGNQSASNDVAMNNSPQPLSDMWQSVKTPVYNDALANTDLNATDAKSGEDLQSESPDQAAPVIDQAAEDKVETVPAAESVQDLTQEQEVKLVRSALRSSLDGEDAELLNDFLSRAKAKRAAKASHPEDADQAETSSSMEESPEIERSTPRARRVLEDLTTNSPSPVKIQLSPSKHDVKIATIGADQAQEEVLNKEVMEEPAPSSPGCRRSTRAKASNAPYTPSVRNTISLRRAKGTEFIFLQRTDAQQMALATKRNTRLNKGKSVSPNVALEALAQQTSEEQAVADEHQRSSRIHSSKKQVSWNEERMAEYEEYTEAPEYVEEEEGDQCKDDVGATPRPRAESKRSAKKAAPAQRSSRRQTEKAERTGESGASDPTAQASTATPRSRRVRRLGDSGKMGSGTPVKTGRSTTKPTAASAPVEAAPSTPTKGRRKVTPKSPSLSKLPAPSKGAKTPSDQSFVSGIPTRSTKGTDDSSQSMLQASAGCTPARRMRSRS
ncbi:unnamed protein product [Penicillium salamii]|nr:unnamed protein product [Penicillium salamii]CAG8080989.1 unnamed protein product [Penicillium salamii]CAG8374868.1 unnamed protein product [Penicillium salamii]